MFSSLVLHLKNESLVVLVPYSSLVHKAFISLISLGERFGQSGCIQYETIIGKVKKITHQNENGLSLRAGN